MLGKGNNIPRPSGLGRACYILASERPVCLTSGEQEGKYNSEGWGDGQHSGLGGP